MVSLICSLFQSEGRSSARENLYFYSSCFFFCRKQDTEKLLEQLASDQEAVDQVHSVVQKEEEIMNEEATRVQAIADEAQRDLEGALPQLEAAIAALDALDKSDISEIRVYTKPPTMVMTVLSAVCVLLQQKPDWNSAKLLLGDSGFLKKLVSYDKNSVPDKVSNSCE